MSIIVKSKSFIEKCVRVLKVARKPTRIEVMQIAKVSAIGLAVIGLLGFAINIAMVLILT
ncbi:MAG: protein translocase SEC61 complex subunit gamma [Candidatus Pacearchaeota archaeon]|nr:protein translocase SEC61 complex subunit gamma [Candidatus Pacearchaeota archaeon]